MRRNEMLNLLAKAFPKNVLESMLGRLFATKPHPFISHPARVFTGRATMIPTGRLALFFHPTFPISSLSSRRLRDIESTCGTGYRYGQNLFSSGAPAD